MENETFPGNGTDLFVFDDFESKLALVILHSLVFLFCFFGNVAVLAVLSCHWKMRGPTKFCLANLAFSNLCVGTFCIFQHLFICLDASSWIFGDLMCKIHYFISSLSQTTSILILVVIAVERYLAIKDPIKTRQMLRVGLLKMVVVGVWIASAIISSPRLYYFHIFPHSYPSEEGDMIEHLICTVGEIYDSSIWDTIHFVLLFLIPLLIISILYWSTYVQLREREIFVDSFSQPSFIVRELNAAERKESIGASVNSLSSWRSPRVPLSLLRKVMNKSGGSKKCAEGECEVGSGPKLKMSYEGEGGDVGEMEPVAEKLVLNKVNNNVVKRSSRESRANSAANIVCNSRKRVLRMLIAIVVTFALCNLPFQLVKIYLYLDGQSHWWTFVATSITRLLIFANSAINPILYAFMSPSFRSCFKDCIRCQVKRPSSIHQVNKV